MRRLASTSALLVFLSFPVFAGENELAGTYRLVVEQRQIVDTGEIVPVKNPQGYIMYGNDGRMIAIVVRAPRPKPESIEKTTDQERADLFRTMTAYAGTYKVDGTKGEDHSDLSWSECWRGTTQGGAGKLDGERPVSHSPPAQTRTPGE